MSIEMRGSESCVVGLGPSFWAHVPLFIHQIQNYLHLMNGVNCLLLDSTTNESKMNFVPLRTVTSEVNKPLKLIPISRCTLVGTIVSMERKSTGCVMFVLDDGTGLIDVLQYEEDDFLSLPLLTRQSEGASVHDDVFEPGDLVRVFGRLQCVSIVQSALHQHKPKWILVESAFPVINADSQRACRINCSESFIREVHASLILPIATKPSGRGRPVCNFFEKEYEHWMDCARHLEKSKYVVGCIGMQHIVPKFPILSNALDVMQVLGNDLSTQVWHTVLSSDGDMDENSWQVFGRQCKCCNVILKHDLLYCHCTATPDTILDPEFRYRDALLAKLLQRESGYICSVSQLLKPFQDDVLQNIKSNEVRYHFQFQYRDIVMDEELNQIALDELRRAGCLNATVDAGTLNELTQDSIRAFGQVRRLIRNAFQALWKDGIVYLVDANIDTYLLLSRKGVLEPHIRSKMALQKLSAETRARYYATESRPQYLDHVPRARLQFIRRSLS